MNSLQARLKKIEAKLSGTFITAVLQDGSVITFKNDEPLDIFLSLIRGAEHPRIEQIPKIIHSNESDGQLLELCRIICRCREMYGHKEK